MSSHCVFAFFIVCSQVSGGEGAVSIRAIPVQETAVRHLVPPLPQGQEWRVSFKPTAGGAAETRTGLIIDRITGGGQTLPASWRLNLLLKNQ